MAYGYIAPLSDKVERAHVRYNNRYGIAIAADVYTAKDLDREQRHPALIVGAPFGGTKEQGPCVYANELAQRGFVVLTFDQVYMGESGGEPRHIASPELFAESFSAAVDFLGVRVPYVDRERIGVIGICGSGGFALSAASVDVRIKAIATTSMYDITGSRTMFGVPPEALEQQKGSFPSSAGRILPAVSRNCIPSTRRRPGHPRTRCRRWIPWPMNGIAFMLLREASTPMHVMGLLTHPVCP